MGAIDYTGQHSPRYHPDTTWWVFDLYHGIIWWVHMMIAYYTHHIIPPYDTYDGYTPCCSLGRHLCASSLTPCRMVSTQSSTSRSLKASRCIRRSTRTTWSCEAQRTEIKILRAFGWGCLGMSWKKPGKCGVLFCFLSGDLRGFPP